MITIATLNKPYTEAQRMDFIVEYNHKQGYTIEEGVNNEGVECLQALGFTEEELQAQERERINMLSLTAADVERAIYKAKGMDFEDIVSLVETQATEEMEGVNNIDVKALKIELKANNFYRGNPWINEVGALLGFTPEMLDRFFESGEWEELVKVEDVEFPPEGVNEVSSLDDRTTPLVVKGVNEGENDEA